MKELVNNQDTDGISILQEAAKAGNRAIVKALLSERGLI